MNPIWTSNDGIDYQDFTVLDSNGIPVGFKRKPRVARGRRVGSGNGAGRRPKKPMSSYLLFCQVIRNNLRKMHVADFEAWKTEQGAVTGEPLTDADFTHPVEARTTVAGQALGMAPHDLACGLGALWRSLSADAKAVYQDQVPACAAAMTSWLHGCIAAGLIYLYAPISG
jgi:hypothetical protein